MKERIAELKKMDEHQLRFLCEQHGVAAYNYGDLQVSTIPIEVISARMWEKAVKEYYNELIIVSEVYLLGDITPVSCKDNLKRITTIMNWVAFTATPTEKLICAIAALKEK